MSDVVNIGIISLGGAGRAHLERFKNNPKAKVVAIYDPKPEIVHHFAKDDPDIIVATTKEEEFFACKEVQAVSICSPNHAHAGHALQALKRGWHVLCEKPLTTDVVDADRLVLEVQRTGLKFAAHHQLRYVPTFSKCKEYIASGRLGRVFAIEADYYRCMMTRATQYDDWRMNPTTYPEIALGGGCHVIDLIQWLLEDRIVEVSAYANHLGWPEYPGVDTVIALVKFSKGALGKMTVSTSCQRPIYHPLLVMGTDGTIVNGMVYDENAVRKVLHFPKDNLRRSRRLLGRLVAKCYDMVQYPFDHNEHDVACEILIDQFLDSVLYNAPVPVTVEESADVVRICDAVIESYEQGKPVKVC